MHTRAAIRTAIETHRRLSFRYHNRPRIVIPLRFGLSASGAWQLRAVQVGGGSDSGHFGGPPKLFDVDQMDGAVVMADEFRVPRQYQRRDVAFIRVDSEL
jgi:hypothetical protein